MTQREAMAVLVSAIKVSYAGRAAALRQAGGALSLLEDPAAYVHVLGEEGVVSLREAIRQSEWMLSGLKRDGVQLVMRGDAGYPRLLEHAARPPHLLFCLGDANLNDPFPFAVVGTRGASEYGLRHTRAISRDLAQAGMCIVSGLAQGVDAAAHLGALEARGRTVAVLGGALDKFYPAENRGLMREILAHGGSVISEYAPGVRPTRYSFLERNRIIAGMSLGTLVTEGPMRSGAANTAHWTTENGREVFALPGDVDRPAAALPNSLLGDGASVATCAADILGHLVIEAPEGRQTTQAAPQQTQRAPEAPATQAQRLRQIQRPAPQDDLQRRVYDALGNGELDFDALCECTRIASDEMGALLMMMELEGLIRALPGCRYALD